MKKKNSKLRFALGMVIYALVILLIASVAMKFEWDALDLYEKSLPEHKMSAYVASLDETHVKKISINFVATLDHNVQSDEDAYSEIWKCFVAGVQFRQTAADSETGTVTYSILNKDHKLGEVVMRKNGDGLGEKTWSVISEEYDFSFLINSEKFIVPEHWVVMCGDRRLGVQYIVNPRVEYSFLSGFYGNSFPMPYLAEYEIGNYIGDPKIRFFDADGVEKARFVFTDGREQMLRSTGKIYEEIESFTETFIPLYVNCLSNVSRSAGTNYQRIRPLLVLGGELDRRLVAAMGGQAFAQSRGTELSDIRIHEVFNLENEYYIVDLSYSVDTYSNSGVSTSDTNMYLALYREEEVFKAQMVDYY